MAKRSEANIQREIMLALSAAGCLVWRNNCGAYTDPRTSYHIRYGVGNPGGSDLIGITPTGRFLAVEVKTETGRVSKQQRQFLQAVADSGGIAGVCRSAEDAIRLINEERE